LFGFGILVFRAVRHNYLFNRNRNDLRQDRRVVGEMPMVAQQQLQRVLAGIQRQFGRGAAVAEVNMLCVSRDRLPKVRQTGIYEKVMMS
jgi:hypothetical protein